jgi:hypothetical protein
MLGAPEGGGGVIVHEVAGVRHAPPARATTVWGRWLALGTGLAWALVATMRYWWSWLWGRLGLLSVPVDIVVWVLAIILTILVVPVLWQRVRRAWPVVFVVAVLVVGGTAVVLAPWHDALAKAWVRTECGTDACAAGPVTNSR